MASTYVNDLRLEEIGTGDQSGTWGNTTNLNLELIGEALGYATQQVFSSDADATTTIADGASDPARAMYFKITSAGSLTATRTCTIAPNTISRVMFIENATSGSQSIAISQGSGASVTILTGKTAVVYLDGAGAGAAVVDAMAGVDPGVTDTLTEVLVAGNTSGGTNIELSTTDKVQFRDAAIYLNSSVDGQLDIVADTEIQIAATTIDVNGTLAFDSLKGTGATTVTNILDEDNMASDSATAIATQQSIKAYVDSQVGSFDTLAEVLTQGNTTGGTDLAVSTGDDITFADNSKAIFGAGSDLQIYSDGTTGQVTGNVSVTGRVAANGAAATAGLAVASDGSALNTIQVQDTRALAADVGGSFVFQAVQDGAGTLGTTAAIVSGRLNATSGNTQGYLTFLTGQSGGLTEGMRLDASGNVGIGTSSPDVFSRSYTGTITGISSASGETALMLNSSGTNVTALEMGRAGARELLLYDTPTASQLFSITSKPLALGTAGVERMRIDASGNVSIGHTTSTGSKFAICDGANAQFQFFPEISTDTNLTQHYDPTASAYMTSETRAASHSWKIGTDLKMTLDASGNVGIGVSASLQGQLNVGGDAGGDPSMYVFGSRGASDNLPAGHLTFRNVANGVGDVNLSRIQSLTGTGSNQTQKGQLVFSTNDGSSLTEAMRINASGNVGIGVTPNAFASEYTALQVGKAGRPLGLWSGGYDVALAANLYQPSVAVYHQIGAEYRGALYTQFDGGHSWATTTNVGADTAVVPTTVMTLDASGNLGIGATGALTSTYLSKAFVYTAGGANFAIGGSSNTNDAVLSRFTSFNISNSNSGNESSANFYGVTSIESIVVTTDSNAGDDSGGSLLFKTKPEAGALAERMRIDAAGNLQMGVAGTNNGRLDINAGSGTYIIDAINAAGARYFAVDKGAPVNSFIVDSGGNVGIGHDGSYKLDVLNTTGNVVSARITTTALAAQSYGAQIALTNDPNDTTRYFLEGDGGGNARFRIYSNGNMVNQNNSYTGISDEKLKENIVDAGSQWDDIKALRVRKYSFKEENASEPTQIGVIAQEVEAAGMSGLVYETADQDTAEDGSFVDTGEVTKTMKYSILYMKAVKALQEAMDRIETLEAKVAALES
jgi:hypothetical protein